jgi:hypothetical protein
LEAQDPDPSQELVYSVLREQLGGDPQGVVFAGYVHAPDPSHAEAPQVASAMLHAAAQQFPVPLMPQTPD